MQTARAIVLSAVIVAATGAATAWAIAPRYSLTNVGQGVSIRLDRSSGDLLGCRELDCRKIADKAGAVSDATPPLPPGFELVNER
jgi:hypothetical protein